MNLELIDQRIIDKLHDNNWNENKKDISLIIDIFNDEGLTIFNYAKEILTYFQGAIISFTFDELKQHGVSNFYGDIQFDASLASGLSDFILDRSKFLQEDLYPIGFINGQMLLCVGRTKHIYTFSPLQPLILGENMIDFLNKILG